MKKAKVMLTAIAVVAVVSAGLAFKAHKGGSFSFYTSTTPTSACNVPTTLFGETITPDPTGIPAGTLTNYNFTTLVAPCPATNSLPYYQKD